MKSGDSKMAIIESVIALLFILLLNVEHGRAVQALPSASGYPSPTLGSVVLDEVIFMMGGSS